MSITFNKGSEDFYISFSNTVRLNYVDKKIIRECSDSTVVLYLEEKYKISFSSNAADRIKERRTLVFTIREIREELEKE